MEAEVLEGLKETLPHAKLVVIEVGLWQCRNYCGPEVAKSRHPLCTVAQEQMCLYRVLKPLTSAFQSDEISVYFDREAFYSQTGQFAARHRVLQIFAVRKTPEVLWSTGKFFGSTSCQIVVIWVVD
jgi:hypothetical protein